MNSVLLKYNFFDEFYGKFLLAFILLHLFVVNNCLNGQEKTLKYRVVDETSFTPIPMAHIEIGRDGKLGTVSNLDGFFNIVPSSSVLNVSCVGYASKQIEIKDIDTDSLIRLEPAVYELNEVVVSNIKPKNIVREVHQAIAQNYPLEYPKLEGTFRQQITEDGKYVLFGECNMEAYIPLLKEINRKNSRVKLSNVRVSKNIISDKKNINLTASSVLIAYPTFYYFTPSFIDNFEWFLEEISLQEDDEVYKIKFKGVKIDGLPFNEKNEGYVYISKKDKAVLKISRKEPGKDIHKKSGKTILDITNGFFYSTYEYKKDGESNYKLDYARVEWVFDLAIREKNSRLNKHKFIVTSDYVVHNYGKRTSRGFKDADIYPFKDSRNVKNVNDWEKFKTILPDYEDR